MPKRPRLTTQSFLAFIFHPTKNPTPAGIRHTSVKASKGRKPARVRSYNKLSAEKQEILRRTGNREAYLKGETTLLNARRELRTEAVTRGITKPLGDPNKAISNLIRLANQRPSRPYQTTIRPEVIETNVRERMKPRQIIDAGNLQSYNDLYTRATSANENVLDRATGEVYNPFWYK